MKQFMRIAGAGLLAAAMASPSFAADMPKPVSRAPVAPAMVATPFSWSGFYVGINGGLGLSTTKWSRVGSDEFGINGGLAGGTLGYNIQNGRWVWGVEADADASTIKGANANVAGVCGGAAGGCETSNQWLATARGRIGYAWDRLLPYVTGGMAVGDIKMTPDGGPSQTATRAGWAAGAGVEYALIGAWSAKLEYLHADLGKATCTVGTCGAGTDVSLTTNQVKAGVNYRF